MFKGVLALECSKWEVGGRDRGKLVSDGDQLGYCWFAGESCWGDLDLGDGRAESPAVFLTILLLMSNI